MKSIISLLVGAALTFLTSSAMAVPISGNIAFVGVLELTGSADHLSNQNATGIHFINPSLVTTGATGTYAAILGLPYSITTVTFKDFSFDPVLSPSPVDTLWTLNYGVNPVNTYDFILNSMVATPMAPDGLLLNGTGTLRATGFDATPGSWSLTTQDGSSGMLAFSAASDPPIPVAEPVTMLLLGAGFLTLSIFSKRMRNA